MTATLLIEIGVEELPLAAMRPLADALADGLGRELTEAGISHGPPVRYASPRRLAVAIPDTAAETAEQTVEKAGPTVAIAFDADGHPTPAGEGFARSVGVPLAELAREDSDKGERLVYRGCQPGRPLAELLQAAVDTVLRGLPIPKRMRWGNSDATFVRPVHWVVALHGKNVLPLTLFGIAADRLTRGHRFHHPEPLALTSADDYATVLAEPGHVLADPDTRKARILRQVHAAAEELHATPLIDDALADEVTALVEWPMAIAGRFEERFLALPREVLIATLEGHQRYFPVENQAGNLVAGFVAVANIDSLDVQQVITGNERVIRPRLADAYFFWEQDRRVGLDSHIPGLARVSFQQTLGSLADKTERVRKIAARLAALTGADSAPIDRAAILAKTDLLTEMVGEFPELQGIMGGYYAHDAGEPKAVAQAIAEQYAPAGAGAPIASSEAGRILAIADRLDTLAGIFVIGKRPSGDKDPFALRRAALGVLRTLIEAELDIDLAAMLEYSAQLQPVDTDAATIQALWSFHVERLRGHYRDLGFPTGAFEAVAALDIRNIRDFDRRLLAVAAFSQQAAAHTVGSAHKRIRNILRRNASDVGTADWNASRLAEPAEQQLAATLDRVQAAAAGNVHAGAYTEALADLAELAAPLDAFFDQVMVMSEEPALRQNRLALLNCLDKLCREVADLSCLSLQ